VILRRHGRQALALLAAAAALATAACGDDAKPRAPAGPPGELALGMPVQDAVAQLFAVGFAGTGPQAAMVKRLRKRAWGVVVLQDANTQAPLQTRTLARSLLAAAHRGGRPAPLIAAAHPETFPGVQMVPPYQQTNAGEARGQARRAASVLRASSVRAAFAPDADIAYATGPSVATSFSDDADRVARFSRAAVEGWKAGGVQPIVGHFPGQGAASQDPGAGPGTVGLSLDEMRQRDLKPFAAVADTAPAVEMSNAIYVAFDGVTPASILPDAHRLLRRMGFEGAAVSGDLVAATATTGTSVGQAAVDALRAGADLLYVPGDAGNQEEAYRAVLRAVQRRRISRERLAEALMRVSALKRAALAQPQA